MVEAAGTAAAAGSAATLAALATATARIAAAAETRLSATAWVAAVATAMGPGADPFVLAAEVACIPLAAQPGGDLGSRAGADLDRDGGGLAQV